MDIQKHIDNINFLYNIEELFLSHELTKWDHYINHKKIVGIINYTGLECISFMNYSLLSKLIVSNRSFNSIVYYNKNNDLHNSSILVSNEDIEDTESYFNASLIRDLVLPLETLLKIKEMQNKLF